MSFTEIAELWTVLKMESSGFSKGVLSAEAQAEESSSKIGQGWQKLAKAGQASALVMVAAAGASVKLAMDFDQQMALVHTQAGASTAEVKALSGQVLNLAGQVGIGPAKLAEGLYHVESAGFRGAAAMGILTAAAKLSAIGQSDLETTTQAVVGVMASQIKGVKGAADAGNLLNTTVGIGDMRMQQLAGAIATGILPKAKSVGLSFEDVGGALATITDNVTPANEAATRLGMTFSMMAAPTQKAQQMMQTLGMTGTQLGNDLRSKGLVGALQDLQKHMNATYPPSKAVILTLSQQKDALKEYSKQLVANGVPLNQQKDMMAAYAKQLKTTGSAAVQQSQAISALFGGGKSSGTILTLLGEMPRLQSKMAAYGTATSRAAQAQDAWKTQQAQFSQQLKDLGASAEAVGVKVGNFLIPPLQKGLGWLEKHQIVLKAFAVILGSVMVAAMAAWTSAVVANTVAMLADPMTWIIVAIVAAIALLVVGIYELVKHWGTVWKWIKGIAEDVWGWMKDAWHDLWDKGIKAAALAVWHWLEDAWSALWDGIKATVFWIKSNIVDPIVEIITKFFVDPIKFYLHVFVMVWKTAFNVIRGIVEFAAGFLSVVFGDIRRLIVTYLSPFIKGLEVLWRRTWALIVSATQTAVNIVMVVVHALERAWDVSWAAIKSVAKKAYDDVILPVAHSIDNYVIKPIMAGVRALEKAWDVSWGAIKKTAQAAWNLLKVVWGYIQRDGIDKLTAGIHAFESAWDKVWNAAKSAVDKLWSHISPIFTKIKNGIHDITGGLSKIGSSPGKAGASFAHMLGFDQGGWVPGAAGAPLLAVVHGGEFVVSRDMLAGKQATPIKVGGGSGSLSGSGANSVMVQMPDIYLDGKKIYKGQTTRAQRTKGRNTTSFMD